MPKLTKKAIRTDGPTLNIEKLRFEKGYNMIIIIHPSRPIGTMYYKKDYVHISVTYRMI